MKIQKEESILKQNMNKKKVHLLAADGKNTNRDIEKAEIYRIYFCSVFGMK